MLPMPEAIPLQPATASARATTSSWLMTRSPSAMIDTLQLTGGFLRSVSKSQARSRRGPDCDLASRSGGRIPVLYATSRPAQPVAVWARRGPAETLTQTLRKLGQQYRELFQ